MARLKHDVQAVIFIEGEEGLRFLIIERFDRFSRSFHWRLVKGGVKPGEEPEKALLREIKEEVGLSRVEIICRIGSYAFEHKNIRHVVETFLVRADPEEPVRLASSDDGKPLRAFRWARPEEAMGLLRWPSEKRMLKNGLDLLRTAPY